jgi:hypothetical protein
MPRSFSNGTISLGSNFRFVTSCSGVTMQNGAISRGSNLRPATPIFSAPSPVL